MTITLNFDGLFDRVIAHLEARLNANGDLRMTNDESPIGNIPTREGVSSAGVYPEADRLLAEVSRLSDRLDSSAATIDRLQAHLHSLEGSRREGPAPLPATRPTFSPAARKVLARNPLFLDYETTGIRRNAYSTYGKGKGVHQVVEVAVTDADGNTLFSSLVNPGRPIPAGAEGVHGISDADVADAPAWAEIAPALRAILGGRVVAAHNAAFEACFTPEDWGIEWVCTMRLADEFYGKADHWSVRDNPALGSGLAARLVMAGVEPVHAEHEAEADCLRALALLKAMAND